VGTLVGPAESARDSLTRMQGRKKGAAILRDKPALIQAQTAGSGR